jgi:hypothetical protein
MVALLGIGLSWVARPAQYGFALPDGTAGLIDGLTVVATWASVGGVAVGLLATVASLLRNAARRLGLGGPTHEAS